VFIYATLSAENGAKQNWLDYIVAELETLDTAYCQSMLLRGSTIFG